MMMGKAWEHDPKNYLKTQYLKKKKIKNINFLYLLKLFWLLESHLGLANAWTDEGGIYWILQLQVKTTWRKQV